MPGEEVLPASREAMGIHGLPDQPDQGPEQTGIPPEAQGRFQEVHRAAQDVGAVGCQMIALPEQEAEGEKARQERAGAPVLFRSFQPPVGEAIEDDGQQQQEEESQVILPQYLIYGCDRVIDEGLVLPGRQRGVERGAQSIGGQEAFGEYPQAEGFRKVGCFFFHGWSPCGMFFG